MAKRVTFTNGVVKQYSDTTEMLYVCMDPAKNTWNRKTVANLQVGDKISHTKKPEGPVSEIAGIVDV